MPVYDPEIIKTKPGDHDNLGAPPEPVPPEIAEPDDLLDHTPAEEPKPSLQQQEEEAANSEPEGAGGDATPDAHDQVGQGYTGLDPREQLAQKVGGKGGIKKYALLGGIAGTLTFMIAAIVIVLLLLGQYQQVHFATVLRSIGMARFTSTINTQLAQVTLEGATLTGQSTGTYKVSRNLLQKMVGINPQKALTALGRENTMKFTFDGECGFGCLKTKNTFKSVSIDGTEYKLSDYTKGNDYNKLSPREKLAVQNDFARAIQNSLADRLSIENRAFRSSAFSGVRQATGISMSKWANKARDFLGKTPAEATALNTEETVKRVSGADLPQSGVEAIKDGVEAAKTPTDPAKIQAAADARARGVKLGNTTGSASVVVLATTVGCIIHDLNNSFVQANQDRELGMARIGHDALTTADQIKSGDTVAEAVSAENARWVGASDSYYYKTSIGNATTPTDRAQLNSIPSANSNSFFVNAIGILQNTIDNVTSSGLSSISPQYKAVQNTIQTIGCGVVLNPGVQVTVAVAEITAVTIASFFSAGGAAAGDVALHAAVFAAIRGSVELGASVGVGELVGMLIDSAVHSYTSFSGAETSTSLYNDSSIGVNYLEQTGDRQITYGAPMSTADAAATDKLAMQSLKASYTNSSFTNRVFAISNPFSLTGKFVASVPSSTAAFSTFAQRSLALITQLPYTIGSLLLTTKASATSPVETPDFSAYSTQYGWTPAEMTQVSTDPSFGVYALMQFYQNHQNDVDTDGSNLFNKYDSCYTPALQRDIPDYCTGSFLSSDTALHWRVYNAYYTLADWSGANDLGMRTAGS